MNLPLEDYFKSTLEEKLLIKMPERENDHLTVATRLLDKRREMIEVDQALNAQKEEFHMKMESLSQRREDLEKKEYQLRESLLKFDKFFRENDAKKVRATKKIYEEDTIKKLKHLEIKRLRVDIEQCGVIKERLLEKLGRYQIYHKYLESVTEASEDISEIREIIDRYETLTCNLKELESRNKDGFTSINDKKEELIKNKEEKDSSLIKYNITLTEARHQLENKKSLVMKMEDELAGIQGSLAEKTLTLGRIIISTNNLYRIIRKQDNRYTQIVGPDDTNAQLTEICNFLSNLRDIKEFAEKLLEKK